MSAPPDLGKLAQRFGLALRGDATQRVLGVASLHRATPEEVSFFAPSGPEDALRTTRAAAVVLRPADAHHAPGACLLTPQPQLAFARIAALFAPAPEAPPGIHPQASVAAGARVSADASIGPGCSVAAGAEIGPGAILEAGCHVGPGCRVGPGSHLLPRATLVANVRLGARVRVHSGAVLGSAGFGLLEVDGQWVNMPQLGGVRVGDDCEIGANTCIDRGTLDDTVLEHDVRLDNLIHIAHNVHIGAHTAMAGCAAVAGSARIGRHCRIAGGAGIVGHIRIADRVTITARTLVTHSILEPGSVWSSGTPMQDNARWRRNAVRVKQLDALARRVTKLEKDSGHD